MQQTIYIALVKETTPPGLLSSAWFYSAVQIHLQGQQRQKFFHTDSSFSQTLVIAILGASSNSRLHAGWFQGIRGTYDVPACLANRYHIGSTSMSSGQVLGFLFFLILPMTCSCSTQIGFAEKVGFVWSHQAQAAIVSQLGVLLLAGWCIPPRARKNLDTWRF